MFNIQCALQARLYTKFRVKQCTLAALFVIKCTLVQKRRVSPCVRADLRVHTPALSGSHSRLSRPRFNKCTVLSICMPVSSLHAICAALHGKLSEPACIHMALSYHWRPSPSLILCAAPFMRITHPVIHHRHTGAIGCGLMPPCAPSARRALSTSSASNQVPSICRPHAFGIAAQRLRAGMNMPGESHALPRRSMPSAAAVIVTTAVCIA